MTSTALRGVLAALALTFLSAPAMAQDAAARHEHGEQHMHAMMEKHRAEMIRDLHTILKLRPNQEAAFTAFEASMKPLAHADDMDKPSEAMTTPQRLDKMLAVMEEHTDRMRKHVEATKAFYAVLSPDQQQSFDATMRMRHEREEHGGRMGEHHHQH